MGRYDNESVLAPDALNTIYIQHGSPPVFEYFNQKRVQHPTRNCDPPKKRSRILPNARSRYPTYHHAAQNSFAAFDAREDPWPTPQNYTIVPTNGIEPAPTAIALTPSTNIPPVESMLLGIDGQCDAGEDMMPAPSDETSATLPSPAFLCPDDTLHSPPRIIQAHTPARKTQNLDIAEELDAFEPSALTCPDVDDPFAPDIQAEPSAPPTCSAQAKESGALAEPDTSTHGLLNYKKWWHLREVDLSVRGELLTGIPIYVHQDTLRVVNDEFSYFIPMTHVDYIRTPDGLSAARTEFDGRSF